jgi:transcriptional regulator GlxA family with amidase domain
VRELEQAVVVAALVIDRDISRKLLQRPALLTAPHHVRVAEEYLSANWDRLVPIEELVAVSGVGMRTLFRSFNQHRGQSPMQFARLIRLRRAQELLSSPTPETTVLGTALACGYSNSGHFARQYFNAFGERPYQDSCPTSLIKRKPLKRKPRCHPQFRGSLSTVDTMDVLLPLTEPRNIKFLPQTARW